MNRAAVVLIALLLNGCCSCGPEAEAPTPVSAVPLKYAIVIHGGAGSDPAKMTAEQRAARLAGLRRALEVGRTILKAGGTSLDAVEAVIRVLEDDPLFNAGKGAVFNARGQHELDASIMDGKTRACGALAGVTTVKNPISLARLVMTKTRHVLFQGAGADEFARAMKVPLVENTYFDTEHQRRSWQRRRAQKKRKKKGTVGCVALDEHGNLAAGTSTGGLTGKEFGRVGDSPIVGAGTYADNRSCGVSCTGTGEEYIRNAVAYDVSAQMRYAGRSIEEAIRHVLTKTLAPNDGGIIGLDKHGRICADFNTPGMAWGAADATGRFEVHLGRAPRN